MQNANHNMTMPQPKFFFVYVLWREDDPNPLQTHVAFGFTRESAEETRKLVRSGTDVKQLLSMSEVHDLLPYHYRRIHAIADQLTPVKPEELSPAYRAGPAGADTPGTDNVVSTLFSGGAKIGS